MDNKNKDNNNHASPLPSREHLASRFFIVKSIECTFATVSPFLIQKCLNASVGNAKSVKKLLSGDLLVEVSTQPQAAQMLKVTVFGNIAVSVAPHGYLNSSRGVISEADLLHTTEEEILEHLRDQLVSGVRRINIRRDGNVLPTKHLILTFDTPKLPSFVIAGYLRCPIRPYVQNPLRCFQCQRFGHSKASCRGSAVCARCAQPGHTSETCNAPAKCVNCLSDHTSYSRSCPKWMVEKEIQTLRAHNSLSYMEAKKQIEARTPRVGVSYASVASTKKVMCTACTQTEPDPTTNKPQKIKNSTIPSAKSNSQQTKINRSQLPSSASTSSKNIPPQKSEHSALEPNRNRRISSPTQTNVTSPPACSKKVRPSSPPSAHQNVEPKQSYHIDSNSPIPPNRNRKKVAIPRKCIGLSRKAKDPNYILKNHQYVRRLAADTELKLYVSEESDNDVVFEES